MADNVAVWVDASQTIENIDRLTQANRAESIKIVDVTAKVIKKRMRANLRAHQVTGNLYRSVTIKKTRPKEYRPILPEDRELFKSVHPRNRKAKSPNKKNKSGALGGHAHLLDYGTWSRKTKRRWWRWGKNRGRVQGINFRLRARDAASAEFVAKVRKMVNKNEVV